MRISVSIGMDTAIRRLRSAIEWNEKHGGARPGVRGEVSENGVNLYRSARLGWTSSGSQFVGQFRSEGPNTVLEGGFSYSRQVTRWSWIGSYGFAFYMSSLIVRRYLGGLGVLPGTSVSDGLVIVGLTVPLGMEVNRILEKNQKASEGLLQGEIERALNDGSDDD